MLSYRDVSKRYGDVIALKGVTLEFQPGKYMPFWALMVPESLL